jgi:hypothetical protein
LRRLAADTVFFIRRYRVNRFATPRARAASRPGWADPSRQHEVSATVGGPRRLRFRRRDLGRHPGRGEPCEGKTPGRGVRARTPARAGRSIARSPEADFPVFPRDRPTGAIGPDLAMAVLEGANGAGRTSCEKRWSLWG